MLPRGVDEPGRPARDVVLSVPEIRDYELINKELAHLLSAGVEGIVLASVGGQRLLASRLRGPWVASILVDGHAGPELGAELDAPGLRITARGDVADAAGRGLIAGRIEILGGASDGLGYGQRGGTIVVRGDAGHRAGLLQRGGLLVVAGRLGRLAGEGQRGGTLVARDSSPLPHAGRGRRGGRLLLVDPGSLGASVGLPDLERLYAESAPTSSRYPGPSP